MFLRTDRSIHFARTNGSSLRLVPGRLSLWRRICLPAAVVAGVCGLLAGQDDDYAEPPPAVIAPLEVAVDLQIEARSVINQLKHSRDREKQLQDIPEALAGALADEEKLPWGFYAGQSSMVDTLDGESAEELPADALLPRLRIRLIENGETWTMRLSLIALDGDEYEIDELDADIRKPGTSEPVPKASKLAEYLAGKLNSSVIRQKDGDGNSIRTPKDMRIQFKEIIPIAGGHVLHGTVQTVAEGAVLLPWAGFRKLSGSVFEMVALRKNSEDVVSIESHGKGKWVHVKDASTNGANRKVIRVTHESVDDDNMGVDINSLRQLNVRSVVFLREFKTSKKSLAGGLLTQ